MPPLTRAAAARLAHEVTKTCRHGDGETDESENGQRQAATAEDALVLREGVAHKRDAVCAYRGGVDAYTGRPHAVVPSEGGHSCQVDHCIEVQLAEWALAGGVATAKARGDSLATTAARDALRASLNAPLNLNATTRRHNQAKKGPFTAALNRLQSDRLRGVTVEQLARQGRARWLVDSGDWARIEACVVSSYDAVAANRDEENITCPNASRIVSASIDELHSVFERLGLH